MAYSSSFFSSDIDFVLKSKYALFSINQKRGTNYSHVKPKQSECIKHALNCDTLVVLPTGYGKSLVYELIQKILNTKVIIISPLNAIIDEQMKRFGDAAIRIDGDLIRQIQDNSDMVELNRLKQGAVSFLIGHPEFFLEKAVCDVLTTKGWVNVSHIFVDEAHCVVTWGHDFRPAFEKLSKLRSLFPAAKVVAMTATATVMMQKEIKERLLMRGTKVISSSPNRENLKIIVKKRPPTVSRNTDVEDTIRCLLLPYVRDICEQKQLYQKTIIYSNLKTCGIGYEIVTREALKTPDCDAVMECVSQYHAPSTDKKKKQVSDAMRKPDGPVRLLFATEAYGMGADAPDIRQVVHIGPPNSMETYLQEIGRSGRDGNQSTATLFYNASDIGANRKNLKSEMRDFCTADSCRREFICHYFGFEKPVMQNDKLHNCCDYCESSCKCQECSKYLVHLLTEMHVEDVQERTEQISAEANKPSAEMKQILTNALKQYFTMENQISDGVIHTGLSADVLKQIVEDPFTKTPCALCERYSHINGTFIENIFHIIRQVHAKVHPLSDQTE